MILKKIYLYHFRNYTKQEFSFSPGVNWIIGKNGQGKTNLLEAIYLLSTGRSFRTTQLKQLIQNRAPYFYIEAEIEKEGVIQTIKLSFDGETKKVHYNATSYSHFTPLIGLLPHVLYAPDDSALIGGTPSHRRKFLNLHLSQIDPRYLHHLVRYHRAMRQRNELLKTKKESAIEPWEKMMAISGAYLMEKRSQMVEELSPSLAKEMNTLSNGEDHLKIIYEQSLPFTSSQDLILGWKKSRKKEFHFGVTLAGPHRDDLTFLIGDLPAKAFASVGQKHSILAALRLCEWGRFQKKTNASPLLSIDDFGAHLDQKRQLRFQEKIEGLGQIFLTSPTELPSVFQEKQVFSLGEIFEKGSA